MTRKIFALICFLSILGCEEVIDVELDTAEPRLVIDASINWEKGTLGNHQTIKLSTTTGYYQYSTPKVSGAMVYVKNSSNTVFNFIEVPNTGNYVCNDFIPVLNENYSLTVVVNGQNYTSNEKLISSPPILTVEQENELGLNNDEIGIKINFPDFANQRNFYLFRLDSAVNPFPEYQIIDDQFTDGNIMSWLYSHEDLAQGHILYFTQYGVSESYYNYMNLIIAASTGANSGPFQVIPSKVRGNIINQTNPNDYALGFFRLCETSKSQYTIQ